MNFPKAAKLQETLDEESAANEKLNELAFNNINVEAAEGVEKEKKIRLILNHFF